MGIKLNLRNVPTLWMRVWERGENKTREDGTVKKGQYDTTFVLDQDHPQYHELYDVCFNAVAEGLKSEAAAEKWMNKNFGEGNHSDKCCVKDLAERDNPIEGHEDGLYFRAASYKQPRIQTKDGQDQIEKGETKDGDEVTEGEVYGGCIVNASVEIYFFAKHKVLMCNLLGLRFRKDGEAFGGGSSEYATDDDLADDDEKPSRKPSGSKSRRDEKPSRTSSRRGRDDEDGEDEDEKPSRSRRRRDEEEDEDDTPRRSRRSRDEEDDEDGEERPTRRSRR